MKVKGLFVAQNVNWGDDDRIAELSMIEEYTYSSCIRVPKRLGTDGTLSRRQARRECYKLSDEEFNAAIDALLACGLFEEDDHGTLTIPGFLKINKSVAEIEQLTEARKVAGKVGGERSWKARASKSGASADTNADTSAEGNSLETHNQVLKQKTDFAELREVKSSKSSQVNARTEKAAATKSFSAEVNGLAERLAGAVGKLTDKRPVVTAEWLTELDAMIRIDHCDAQEVAEVISWVAADDFWWKPILRDAFKPPAALRKNYAKICAKAMPSGRRPAESKPSLQSDEELAAEMRAQYGVPATTHDDQGATTTPERMALTKARMRAATPVPSPAAMMSAALDRSDS